MDVTEPVLLTPEGLEKLKRDLEVALRRRAEAGERLKEAFQPGDIEDNPEYEQAKEEVGLLDSRIYELQEMIGRAQIIRDTHSSVVGPGSTIEVVHHGDGGGRGRGHTWADMKRDTLAVASGLIAAGVRAGDCVLLMSENRLEWLYCDFAIQAVGAITVPVYPQVSAEAAQVIATDSAATFAIASDAELGAKLTPRGPLKQVVLIDREVREWVRSGPGDTGEVAARLRQVLPRDPLTIRYPSGTTGTPKGLGLAQRNVIHLRLPPVTRPPLTHHYLPIP